MVEKQKRMLLISNSKLPESGFLEHCQDSVKAFMGNEKHVLFLPYARPSGMTHEKYTDELAKPAFERMGFVLTGVHEHTTTAKKAVENAEAIFVGGGNTFVLLDALYRYNLIDVIQKRVAEGMPYMGASAGTNVAGKTIKTTNDNPIVQPASFDALGLVPFIFKPHYLDPDPKAKHTRETDETRIKEYHAYNSDTVVGLREGAMLQVTGDNMVLLGNSARIFFKDGNTIEYGKNSTLSFLLREKT